MNEAILAIPPQSSPFSFEQLKHLLKELSLSAKVTFVVRGGFAIPCADGRFSVDESGLIHLVEKNGD
jgi:hypothetical protein